MSYFDGHTSSCFRQSADGRHIFYPWGALGRGYFISSDQELKQLKRGVKTYFVLGFGLIILVFPFLIIQGYPTEYALYVAPVILPYILWIVVRCRQMQRADVRLTIREGLENSAQARSWVVLLLLEIVSILFVLGGAHLLITKPDEWLVGLAVIAGFGTCTAIYTFMLNSKWRGKRNSS